MSADDQLPLSQAVMGVVRIRMGEQGLSGNRLAQATGLPQATVARWLRDVGAPGIDDLEKVAGALGTTAAELLAAVTRTEHS